MRPSHMPCLNLIRSILSGAAVRVLLKPHSRFNGSNNGKLISSYAEAVEAQSIGKATVQRAYQELVERGLLALEREGNWYHRQAHEWRLIIKPMQAAKGTTLPTHDWRSYQTPKNLTRLKKDSSGFPARPFQNPSERKRRNVPAPEHKSWPNTN